MRKGGIALLLFLFSIGSNVVEVSHAATGLTVQIQGIAANPPSTCPAPYNTSNYVVLSECNGTARAQGTNLTIAALDTTQGPARVEVVDNNTDDHLRLVNAIIKSTAAPPANCDAYDATNYVNCPDISFLAVFSEGPDASSTSSPPTPAVYFYRKGAVWLQRSSTTGAATNSSFRFDGWVYPSLGPGGEIYGPWKNKVTCLNPVSCWQFSTPGDTLIFSDISGDRELTGHVWFKLNFANNDMLKVTSLIVENPSGSGGGGILGHPSLPGQSPAAGQGCASCCVVCDQPVKKPETTKKKK
jgi:hypothetical protein